MVDILIQLPAPREDFETKILAKDKVDTFTSALDEKDRQILQMRMDGCTLEQIAAFFGYKTPSAIYKRIQKIATAYEDFVSREYGEFLESHSKKKKNKQKRQKQS